MNLIIYLKANRNDKKHIFMMFDLFSKAAYVFAIDGIGEIFLADL